MQFDRDKFKALLHYVIWKTGNKDGFGATKLYKVLWFSDARAFMLHKASITGERYIRREHGPFPEHAPGAIQELQSEGAVRIRNDSYFNRQLRRHESLRTPDRLTLSDEQRKIVDHFIAYVADEHTAQSISDESHDYGWDIAKMGEELPYFAIFASRIQDPSDSELEWAKSRARELGLP